MHKQKIFRKIGLFKKISLPNSEYLSSNGFYLPSGLGLKATQLKFIVKTLNELLK